MIYYIPNQCFCGISYLYIKKTNYINRGTSRDALTSTGSNIYKGDISMAIYSTTFSRSNKPQGFYVYAYLNEDGLPYYIGKGQKNRAWSPHRVEVPSNDKIIILESNLTEIGAYAIERRMVRWWGRKDIGEGILLNRSEGGHSFPSIVSNDTRKILSEKKIGKSRPEWVRNKISEKMKGKSNFQGKTHNEITKLKMKERLKGNQNARKKVNQP
jgi:hypothetical protein